MVHDLERKSCLSFQDRCSLEDYLNARTKYHARRVASFCDYLAFRRQNCSKVTQLDLKDVTRWPQEMAPLLSLDVHVLKDTFIKVGTMNKNPELPVQGVLLTCRIGNVKARKGVLDLLFQLEKDSLCEYLLVVALDKDEADSKLAKDFVEGLERYFARRTKNRLFVIENPVFPSDSFPICHVWHSMAEKAWLEGASWVVLLGDDVSLDCPFHYRAIYRCFLTLHKEKGFPQWFGCPWFNDTTFSGFPTFPVIGAEHYKIFGGLIPQERNHRFCNQDLDPYLQRM